MFKTQVIKELADAIYDLEVYVSRTVHNTEDYKIEDGLIISNPVETVRNKILNELHLLDDYLFNQVDDGR